MIAAFTDYPILRMGDKAGEIAPVRPCKVLAYDGDKYCRVKVGRYVESIKRGYIYIRAGRVGEVPCVSVRRLNRLAANRHLAKDTK